MIYSFTLLNRTVSLSFYTGMSSFLLSLHLLFYCSLKIDSKIKMYTWFPSFTFSTKISTINRIDQRTLVCYVRYPILHFLHSYCTTVHTSAPSIVPTALLLHTMCMDISAHISTPIHYTEVFLDKPWIIER